MNIQKELNLRGANLKVGGIVGPKTANAVRNMQKDLNRKGAGLKVDGDWGEKTHNAMFPYPKDKPKGGVINLSQKLDPNKPKYDRSVKLPYKDDMSPRSRQNL